MNLKHRRPLQIVGLTLLALALMAVGALVHGLRTTPPVDASFNPPVVTPSKVKTLFLGTSSMAWTDGESTWLVDGFFSRQALTQVAFSRLDVEKDRVLSVATVVFRRLQVPPALSGIVVAHSHYDHSLDAPFLINTFGGRLVGSDSTGQIAKGQAVPDAQVQVVGRQGVARFGQFQVELRESAHAPTGFTGGFNSSPLLLPAHALSFKEGISYTFLVSHPFVGDGPFALIQPSAGFVPGQNKGVSVDSVFLGAGGLGKLDEQYLAAYWQEMVLNTGARQVYLIHWDNFTLPLMAQGQPVSLQAMPSLVDDFAKSHRELRRMSERDGVGLNVLNAWDIVEFQTPF